MNTTRIAGLVLTIGGGILLILSALADVIGLGREPNLFGPWQVTGIVVAVIAVILGVLFLLRKKREKS